eukprot:8747789-Heterocapsa_arctica.AAC.1
MEENKRRNAAEREANFQVSFPKKAPGEPQGTGGEEPVEVELEEGQEEESWEEWLEQAKKRSEENLQKAIEDAANQ